MTTNVDISIRPATEADAKSISRLIRQLSREFVTPDYTPEGAATLLSYQTSQAIRQAIQEDVVYLVAELGKTLTGVLGALPRRRHVYHLFVARTYHRRGIGRCLWETARKGLGPGTVTVNSSRFAIGFYERLGFVSTGPPWEKDGMIAYPMRWDQKPGFR